MARILVIDDDSAVRMALEQLLKSEGYEVLLSENGTDGILQQRKDPSDLLIIDLFMPGKPGLDTILEMRNEFPGVPVIAISGGHLTSHTLLVAASTLGTAFVLEKPFDKDSLLLVVKNALAKPSQG